MWKSISKVTLKLLSPLRLWRIQSSPITPVASAAAMRKNSPALPNDLLLFRRYRALILMMTFVAYASYHMSRKPISVVKTKLLDCNATTNICNSFISEINGTTEVKAKRLEGILDSSYLFSYALFMFISGPIAERVDLRYFLSFGMFMSGICTMLFGLAYYWEIHSFSWFIFIQVLGGAFQSTGWPGVVTVVANWFGKGKKGLIFGIWNSHTSIGNILGSLLAGHFVEESWGLSFIVPGLIITAVGVYFFFVLVAKPEHVGLDVNALSAVDSLGPAERSGSRPTAETTPLLDDAEEENVVEVFSDDDKNLRSRSPASRSKQARAHGSGSSATSSPSSSPGRGGGASAVFPPAVASTSGLSAAAASPIDQIDPVEVHPVAAAGEAEEEHAISFMGALRIPGVLEFSLCLFFAKLVSYTFLYWLPTFIMETGIDVTSEDAAYLSTLFDVGGIMGGILAGVVADLSGKSASTCAVMLVLALPVLFGYESYGQSCQLDWSERDGCYPGHVGLLVLLGVLVNGPYSLITTAVSADLGMHPSLRGSSKALATVTCIIDGTGSIGAAIGPFLAGAIPDNAMVFYMLMGSDVMALLLLTRLVKRDIEKITEPWRLRRRNHMYHRQS